MSWRPKMVQNGGSPREFAPGVSIEWETPLPELRPGLPVGSTESYVLNFRRYPARFRLCKEREQSIYFEDVSQCYFSLQFEVMGISAFAPGFRVSMRPVVMTIPPYELMPVTTGITNESRIVWRVTEEELQQHLFGISSGRIRFHISYLCDMRE